MKSDFRAQVNRRIQTQMGARGWSLLSLWGLPASYLRDAPVTPYFHCSSISLRPYGDYVIEGAMGVIHQGFESAWLRNEARAPTDPGLGVLLNIANFEDLREKRHIEPGGGSDSQVDQFCVAVVEILDSMPHDDHSLIAAYKSGLLAGAPLKAFAGYAYRSKFSAFEDYLGHLAASTSQHL